MIQRMVLGIVGGALIVLSVFIVGNTVAFDAGVPESGSAWVALGAGIVVALFALIGVRTLIAFGAGAAATLAATAIIDEALAGSFEVTARLVVLAVGVLAALAATIARPRAKVVVEAEPEDVTPIAVKPTTRVVAVRPTEAKASSVSVAAARDEATQESSEDALPAKAT